MNNEKIVNLLSMAQRAGCVASGDAMVREAFASRRAQAVLLAEDAAADTKKFYREMAEKSGIPVFERLDKDAIGCAIGRAQRAAAVLLDRGFSDALRKRIEDNL